VTQDPAEDLLDVFEPWNEPSKDPARPPTEPHRPPSVPDFLREEAIPEIMLAARRLEAADHQLTVQDLLDLPDAALRVLFWPRPGPMAPSLDRTRATLEFAVQRDDPVEVEARHWSGDDPGGQETLGRTKADALDLEWVRGRFLEFIEGALGQA